MMQRGWHIESSSFPSKSKLNCLVKLKRMGIRKASVLPLPVSASTKTFFFSKTRGIVDA